MKKLISLLLVLVMCFALCSCSQDTNTNTNVGNNASSSDNDDDKKSSKKDNDKKKTDNNENSDDEDVEESNGGELVLGEVNHIEDYIDFTLFKISTTESIAPTVSSSSSYYENSGIGETYIDIIFDLTNIGQENINSNRFAVATATGSNGIEYTNSFYAAEKDDYSYLSQYEEIVPKSSSRVHCAISVPESEKDYALKIVINEEEFTYNYTLGEVVSGASEISVGDTIEEADFATLVFNGIEYTDDLIPPITDGYYTHYAVDDVANTYLVVKYDLTNYMSTERDCNKFVGVKATYMDKYNYTGYVVVEDSDGKGFSSYESLAPLATRHLYYLIEVPKSVTENEVSLTISFNGKEYTYVG